MAIVSYVQMQPEAMVGFVVASLIFDLLDGWAARWLAVSSPLGKELDSLADMVSFGFLPGLVLYGLMKNSDVQTWVTADWQADVIYVIPFLVTAFSALRLAKFNLDARQSDGFIGLPTPANTIWIVSLPLVLQRLPGKFDFLLTSAPILVMISFASAWLLLAEIPLFSFKMKSLSLREYPLQFLLMVFSIVSFILFSVAA
ncbi:MAG: CDP-alcohol phosphatidyltransferase family protein, partial [Flavobacteriales bacterium]